MFDFICFLFVFRTCNTHRGGVIFHVNMFVRAESVPIARSEGESRVCEGEKCSEVNRLNSLAQGYKTDRLSGGEGSMDVIDLAEWTQTKEGTDGGMDGGRATNRSNLSRYKRDLISFVRQYALTV